MGEKETITVSQALQNMVDNPEDDLSDLPQLIAKVQELEGKENEFRQQEEGYQERISKLQEINRSYLAQIPVPGNEPATKEDERPTFKDAQEQLFNAMNNVGGN